jgi:adenylate cyclase
MVQAPLAVIWSVGFQYVVEGRKRRQLHRAFGAYLPPHLVDRIAERDFDLTPGGKEVEATILFTDLEGFTALSEKLAPAEVSQILTAYFDQVTRRILEEEGTVIKYIGDAVMAVWGAPLPDPNQAERAVLAACAIIEAGQREFLGRRLRTRIGLNSGRALAGNLGSFLRFDYTVIGATTNLASRLEKLNQTLGTDILITGATRQRLSERIRVRALGRFVVKGISEPFPLYEVLGTATKFPLAPEWVGPFEQAVGRMEARDWERAEALFQQVIAQRGGHDGPAQFFLKRLALLRSDLSRGQSWDGVTPVID